MKTVEWFKKVTVNYLQQSTRLGSILQTWNKKAYSMPWEWMLIITPDKYVRNLSTQGRSPRQIRLDARIFSSFHLKFSHQPQGLGKKCWPKTILHRSGFTEMLHHFWGGKEETGQLKCKRWKHKTDSDLAR